MAAPVYGDGYMQIASPVSSNPPNAATVLTGDLDPVFATVWDATKYLSPSHWQGDYAEIIAIADVAMRYKTGAAGNVTLASIAPTTGVHGASFTITATGTNFDASSTIVFAGQDLATNSVSGTSLTATVPASLIPAAGTYNVTVRGANNVVTAAQVFTAS